jgi:hypothetical protein
VRYRRGELASRRVPAWVVWVDARAREGIIDGAADLALDVIGCLLQAIGGERDGVDSCIHGRLNAGQEREESPM